MNVRSDDPIIKYWGLNVSFIFLTFGLAPPFLYDELFGPLTPETPYSLAITLAYVVWVLFLFGVWPLAMASRPEGELDV